MRPWALALLPLAALAALVAAGASGWPAAAAPVAAVRPPSPPYAVGSRPPALEGTALDGTSVSPSALSGQVVAVVAWAAWCEPCFGEVALLSRLHERDHARGLWVVGLAQDESLEVTRRFMSDHALAFPSIHDPLGGITFRRWGWATLPMLEITDRAGVLRHRHEGFRNTDAAIIEAEIDALLAEPG